MLLVVLSNSHWWKTLKGKYPVSIIFNNEIHEWYNDPDFVFWQLSFMVLYSSNPYIYIFFSAKVKGIKEQVLPNSTHLKNYMNKLVFKFLFLFL